MSLTIRPALSYGSILAEITGIGTAKNQGQPLHANISTFRATVFGERKEQGNPSHAYLAVNPTLRVAMHEQPY